MRNVLLVWGKAVSNMSKSLVQSLTFSTKSVGNIIDTTWLLIGFTNSFPMFYQTLYPAVFRISHPLLAGFSSLSTPPNNNKNFINLNIYY